MRNSDRISRILLSEKRSMDVEELRQILAGFDVYLTPAQIAPTLSKMVKAGRLARTERGVYVVTKEEVEAINESVQKRALAYKQFMEAV